MTTDERKEERVRGRRKEKKPLRKNGWMVGSNQLTAGLLS
jgi:hypothetical protein